MKLLLYGEKFFPKSLMKIKNPPRKLWAEGNLNLLNEKIFTVIGSRDCSVYGEKWCEIFTKKLVEYNYTIVSGMAIGIDSVAHKSALKYGGKTIAVLPSGLNHIYPEENIALYKKILANNGLIVTEFEPNIMASKEKFLERNRLVSGLGIGTLVVEAEYRSGTSVTASLAKEQGKKVFCIPGSLENNKSLGTNIMIQKGAKLVISPEDVISNYETILENDNLKLFYDSFNNNKKIQKNDNIVDLYSKKDIDNIIDENRTVYINKKTPVADEYKDLYDIICKGAISINMLAKQAKLSISETISKVTMLEIDGLIERNDKQEICIKKLR